MSRKGTILVIDDEEIMREILETLLTREGYEVRLAANAAAGLELIRSMPLDAMKRGAFDYITKPFKNDEVLVVLRNALAQRRLVVENRALRQNLQAHANRFAISNVVLGNPGPQPRFETRQPAQQGVVRFFRIVE